jgi:hypothetical protein
VEVTATGAHQLQTESAEISQTIGSQAVSELPLNGRNYQDLVYLNSSVQPPPPAPSGSANTFVVEGQRGVGNLYMVDGLSTTGSVGGRGDNFSVPLDAVEEFSLGMNSYSAEYGNLQGGVLNLQLKSGTNRWHGSAFEYLENDKLDASNFFSNSRGLSKNEYRFNQFGGSVGGPVKRDKSFFFVDYEGDRTRSGGPAVTTVPSAAQRTGNFTGSNPIFDPTSNLGPPFPGFPYNLRQQYSSNGVPNVIPPSEINSAASAMLADMPLANQFGANGSPLSVLNYAKNVSNLGDADSVDGRLDYNFSSKSMLFARFSYRTNLAVNPNLFPMPLSGTGSNQQGGSDFVSIGHTYSLRPNMVNEIRFGFTRSFGNVRQLDYGVNSDTNFGIPNLNVSPETSGLSTFVIENVTQFGDNIVTPLSDMTHIWQVSDKFTWTVGRHTFRMGGDYIHEYGDLDIIILSRGYFVFEPTMTSNLGSGGNSLASFMSGFPTEILRDTPGHPLDTLPHYALYFQDDFKATSRLTLNLGIHYDILPSNTEANNHIANFNPNTGAMIVAGTANDPYGRHVKMTDFKDIAPRVGIAYALTSDRKTVLRTGYGIGFADPFGAIGPGNGADLNLPFYYRSTTFQFPLSIPAYAMTSVLPSVTAGVDPNHPTGDIRYEPVRDRNPYSQTWNFGIQRSLTSNLFAEVDYTGTRGLRLLAPVNINQGSPGPTDPTTRRLFGSQLGEVWAIQYAGESMYNGLTAKLQQRFSNGLFFLASYTWSRSLDNQSTGTDNSSASPQFAQNPLNLHTEWGRSVWDMPQRFVFSGVWDIPYGHSRHFGQNAARPLDWVLGGWQFSGIYTAQAGTALTATMNASDINADSETEARPDLIGKPNLPRNQRTLAKWFNTAAFAIPSTDRYGSAPRDDISAPGLSNFDLSLHKSFQWGKDTARRVQFRGEMFNAFNNTHFATPDTYIDDPTFGVIAGAGAARVVQFGLRIEF